MLKYATYAVFFSYLAYHLNFVLDLSKDRSELETQTCELISPKTLAVEDFVKWRDGILIGSAGSILNCMHESPERTAQGFMAAIDTRSGEVKVVKLELFGTPEVWQFHPHGISFSKKTDRLYVVNHGGASTIGSRIEMFSVREDKNGLPEFHWIMPIAGQYLPNMAFNSVVEATESDIYFTQFTLGIPTGGFHHPSSWKEVLSAKMYTFLQVASVFRFTGVHHCRFDVSSRSTVRCRGVALDFVAANGLEISPDRTELMVVDPTLKEARVFQRDALTGDLTEDKNKRVQFPHAVDNIRVDEDTGEIWSGAVTYGYEHLFDDMKKSGAFQVGTPLGGPTSSFASKYDVKDEIVHYGTKLSQISACVRVSDPNSNKTWGMCGSPLSNGILSCKL